jgi:hypothetical protein
MRGNLTPGCARLVYLPLVPTTALSSRSLARGGRAVPSVSRLRRLVVDVLQPDGTRAGDPAAASALSEVAVQEIQPSEHGIS